jgi:hypothetical protein
MEELVRNLFFGIGSEARLYVVVEDIDYLSAIYRGYLIKVIAHFSRLKSAGHLGNV